MKRAAFILPAVAMAVFLAVYWMGWAVVTGLACSGLAGLIIWCAWLEYQAGRVFRDEYFEACECPSCRQERERRKATEPATIEWEHTGHPGCRCPSCTEPAKRRPVMEVL